MLLYQCRGGLFQPLVSGGLSRQSVDAARWQADGRGLSSRSSGEILLRCGTALFGRSHHWWSRRIFYQPFFDRFPDFAKYEECGKSDDTHFARYPESKSRKSGASGGTGGACRDQRRVEPGRRLYEAKGQHESGVDSRRISRHPHTAFDGAGVCQRAGR